MILNLVISTYLKIKWSKGIQSCFWVAKVYFKEVKPAFVFDKFIIWKECNLNQTEMEECFWAKTFIFPSLPTFERNCLPSLL